MRDPELLSELLDAETEAEVLAILQKRDLLNRALRWQYLGSMPNNQSIVHAQQSTPAAALVEKFTNGLDAILLRKCRKAKIDPRSAAAPASMSEAVQRWFGDLNSKTAAEIRSLAEENLVLYATGTKARPSLSLYDAGEGQLAEDFPKTFCSLIFGSMGGSYKGAIPFVQGRFNMGGTGVLPFCSEQRKLQLIVSRVPDEIADRTDHEWAYTLFCFFPGAQDPSWKYLIGTDRNVLTAGRDPLRLVPKLGSKSGEVCAPRERVVSCGTLIKMYDFKAPRSNICGELFKKFEDYLLRPAFPFRLIECRPEYKANVMGVNIWDRMGAWAKNKLESGFEEGASILIKLSTGETIPAEVRVFKALKDREEDPPQTGLRALINGQSHAKRDANFFRTDAVDKEHIAGSMLVTLDCTDLGQGSRNALFMSNRETFREDPLLTELLKKLRRELKEHEGLIELNQRRYEEKIADAISDEDGINALEDLLSNDPSLADLFGSLRAGKVAAQTALSGVGAKITAEPRPFLGKELPTFFRRADGSTQVEIECPRGEEARVSFLTDVMNNYFIRRKYRGRCTFSGGGPEPSFRLFNGRLTFTFFTEKNAVEGAEFVTNVEITDTANSGPFNLKIFGKVVAPKEPKEPKPRPKPEPKADAAPSRPDIVEVDRGPDEPPLTIEKVPNSPRMKLMINTGSRGLVEAKALRPQEEAAAVEFVFKYGLALIAMGLLDTATKTEDWKTDPDKIRDGISKSSEGIARVIVPLCLSLPSKLPKAA